MRKDRPKKEKRPPRRIDPFFHTKMNQLHLSGAICSVPHYLPANEEKGWVSSMTFVLCYHPEEYGQEKGRYKNKGQRVYCQCKDRIADYLNKVAGKHTVLLITGQIRQRDHDDGKINTVIFIRYASIQWNLNHKKFYIDSKDLSIDELFMDELESEELLGKDSIL